jgi:cystathionine gamma-synthase
MRLETLAIHAAHAPDQGSGALAPPIVLSTTFERDADGGYRRGHYYARNGNPGREGLEGAIAALESGAAAVALASGSAASAAVFSLLAPGDHVLIGGDCYYGTIKQLEGPFARSGVTHERVSMSRLSSVAERINPRTRLLWVESPSNPLLAIADLAGLARLAHEHGAILACDNTFATPVLQQPFALGADLVIHSTTKYIGGHSDVMGGVVVTRDDGEALSRLRSHQGILGAVPSGFDCWLLRRSLATLPIRIRQQSENALAVARAVAGHRQVTAVHYPGLESHSGHALARRQMSAFGAMLSLQVAGGEKAAYAVAAATRLFTRATSLGGVESLIEHRASMEGTHSRTPPDLLRLSIGLEHAQDLIDDLTQALDAINP